MQTFTLFRSRDPNYINSNLSEQRNLKFLYTNCRAGHAGRYLNENDDFGKRGGFVRLLYMVFNFECVKLL